MYSPALFFFNTEAFLESRPHPDYKVICSPAGYDARAVLVLYIFNNEGHSPWHAGFGGIECSPDTRPEDWLNIITELNGIAQTHELSSISITCPPDCYQWHNPEINAALENAGYELLHTDINFHLSLDAEGLPFNDGIVKPGLISKLSPDHHRRYRRMIEEGFSFEVIPEHQLNTKEAYSLIAATRNRKGYYMGQTEAEFADMVYSLPGVYTGFKVLHKGQTVALGIGLATAPDVYYAFYNADLAEYKHRSPMIMLYMGMAEYAAQHNFRLLDLGTASLHGLINTGVERFKRNLGGQISGKSTFLKKFRN
ncbi:MAG: GNAT family N-acetyltransferase [Bacteroidota bacterium]